jgi:predicted ATPase
MPRGGARPNSGRPPSRIKVTRESAIDATDKAGVTPIEVMAFNLKFWYEAASSLTDRVKEFLQDNDPKNLGDNAPELIKELNANIKNMLFARERAQECAVDMAPYRHPRLANVEMTQRFANESSEPDKPKITHKTDPKDAVRAYEDLLQRGV